MHSRFCARCGSSLEWTPIGSYDVVTGYEILKLRCRRCGSFPIKHFLCFLFVCLALAIIVAWLAEG